MVKNTFVAHPHTNTHTHTPTWCVDPLYDQLHTLCKPISLPHSLNNCSRGNSMIISHIRWSHFLCHYVVRLTNFMFIKFRDPHSEIEIHQLIWSTLKTTTIYNTLLVTLLNVMYCNSESQTKRLAFEKHSHFVNYWIDHHVDDLYLSLLKLEIKVSTLTKIRYVERWRSELRMWSVKDCLCH